MFNKKLKGNQTYRPTTFMCFNLVPLGSAIVIFPVLPNLNSINLKVYKNIFLTRKNVFNRFMPCTPHITIL